MSIYTDVDCTQELEMMSAIIRNKLIYISFSILDYKIK
jgi:hypothetical protein